MAEKRRRILAGLLVAAALVAGGRYALTCPLGFHPRLWEKYSSLRGRMLDDLLEERLSTGMTRDEVCALLGESGNSRYFQYEYQKNTYHILRESYYVRDNGAFYADFLVLYYVEQEGSYIYKAHQMETVDLF